MFLFFHLPALTRTLLISLITLLTLIGIMIRPWKVNEALTALAGAALLLILGLISPADALSTLLHDWNTFLFFLGMMSLSALAEVAGLFDWLAIQAARLSRNSSRRLFLNTFLLGSLISMLLSNDATALILTPVIYTLVTRLRLPVLPYLFACTFIADTASFLLPVSNPINIIVTTRFPLDLLTFLRLLFLPCLLCICVNAGVFYLLYRRQLRGSFDMKRLPSIEESVKHKAYFRYTCTVVILVAAAYILAAATQVPLSLVALSGAFLLLIGALFWKQTTLWNTGKQISWPIFGFIAGMFIVVQALESTGLTAQFGQLLLHLSGGTSFGAVMIGALGSALGTSCVVEFSNELTAPPFDSLDTAQLDLDVNYFDFLEAVEYFYNESLHPSIHRLLGYPDAIQNDMQLECQFMFENQVATYPPPEEVRKMARTWILLLQIDSDHHIKRDWGDNGRIYFWIRNDDLQRRNFERVRVILQCY